MNPINFHVKKETMYSTKQLPPTFIGWLMNPNYTTQIRRQCMQYIPNPNFSTIPNFYFNIFRGAC